MESFPPWNAHFLYKKVTNANFGWSRFDTQSELPLKSLWPVLRLEVNLYSRDSEDWGHPRHVFQFHHAISQWCVKIGSLIFLASTKLASDRSQGVNLSISAIPLKVHLLYFLTESHSLPKSIQLSMYSLLTVKTGNFKRYMYKTFWALWRFWDQSAQSLSIANYWPFSRLVARNEKSAFADTISNQPLSLF